MAHSRQKSHSYKAALALADRRDIRSFLRGHIDRFEFIAVVLQTYHDHAESIGSIMESIPERKLRADCARLVGD